MKVRKAVIPAAGLGTRFLPTSKSLPKELLPVLDVPMIQFGVEEAATAGIEHIILVISQGKEALANYFQPDPELESHLAKSGAHALLEKVRRVSSLAHISTVEQKQQLGLGHAVLTAKDQIGDEPFVVLLPDDLIFHTEGATQQLIQVFERYESSIVAVEEVPLQAVKSYGVVDSQPVTERLHRVDGLVEKPDPQDAPSNLAIVGRYVFTPEIFRCLERTKPGAIGEIQLTDGINLLLEEQPVYAYRFEGTRHDGGTPLGLLKASLAVALTREDTASQVREFIEAAVALLNPHIIGCRWLKGDGCAAPTSG